VSPWHQGRLKDSPLGGLVKRAAKTSRRPRAAAEAQPLARLERIVSIGSRQNNYKDTVCYPRPGSPPAGGLWLSRPSCFRRAKAMLPLRFFGTGDGLVLMVAWLMAALRPRGPYLVLELDGEEGSGKSTRAKMLRCVS
jgi:hypothetical protein